MRRMLTATLLAGAVLATAGAAPVEERAMLEAFDAALTAMAYAGAGLCLFAIVWTGFVLMAEGGEERGGGRAKSGRGHGGGGAWCWCSPPRGVAALLRRGIVDFPIP